MPRQGRIQKQAPEEDKKVRPEEQFVPDQPSFGTPNSLMRAGMMTPPSGTPNSVMREMDPENRGVSFRSRGFDRTVGAHELSHTVRRESVPSPVTQSVSSNTIQRDPTKPGSQEDAGDAAAAEPELTVEEQLNETLHHAINLRRFYDVVETRMGWRVNQLNDQIAEARNPEVAREIRDIITRIQTVAPNLDGIITNLQDARKQLASGASPESIRDLVIAEGERFSQVMGAFNEYRRLEQNPDVVTRLNEIYAEVEDFDRVEVKEDEPVADDLDDEDEDFGFTMMGRGAAPATAAAATAAAGAPPAYGAVYNVPAAAAAAPPSYGTPGAYDEPPAAAAADVSMGTPGAYDEPPSGPASSAPPAKKKDEDEGRGGLFGFLRKKKK